MAEREDKDRVSERDVETLVATFNGDPRAALKAVMHDLSLLIDHHNAAASRGFARRQQTLSAGWGRGVESGPQVG